MPKIAFTTVLTHAFIPGFICLIKSIKKNNPNFNYPFIILDSDGLPEPDKKKIQKEYKHVKFKPVDKKKYRKMVAGKEKARLRGAYYSIDAFSIYDYDKVIYLDSDTLCLGDLDPLIKLECDFAARKDRQKPKKLINTGVMVIGRKYLNKKFYNSLIKWGCLNKGGWLADQSVISSYFVHTKQYDNITYLTNKWNYSKRKLHNQEHNVEQWEKILKKKAGGVRILHFVGIKPWNATLKHPKKKSGPELGYRTLEKLWWKYYES